MFIVQGILKAIVLVMDKLLPAFGVSDSFFDSVNSAMITIVGIIKAASWFVPLDVMVTCLCVMLVIDNYALLMRVGQFIIKLIRG